MSSNPDFFFFFEMYFFDVFLNLNCIFFFIILKKNYLIFHGFSFYYLFLMKEFLASILKNYKRLSAINLRFFGKGITDLQQ